MLYELMETIHKQFLMCYTYFVCFIYVIRYIKRSANVSGKNRFSPTTTSLRKGNIIQQTETLCFYL